MTGVGVEEILQVPPQLLHRCVGELVALPLVVEAPFERGAFRGLEL